MIPTSAELTYFLETAQNLNLTRAAERLGVTQSALSRAITKLEKKLGVALFVRHKHGVSLTQSGEQLLNQVKPLLTHWEQTRSLISISQNEIRGRLSIGCRSAAAHHMTDFLRFLLLEYPYLEIDFNFQHTVATTESVINSTVDIGIVNNPLQHHDLIIHKIADTKMALWVGPGSEDIQNIHSGKAVIICEPNVPQVHILLRELEKRKIQVGRIITANSLEVVAWFASAGCGIGILPSCFVASVHPDKLTLLEDMPTCPNEVCLIYRVENKGIPLIRTVLGALKRFAEGISVF